MKYKFKLPIGDWSHDGHNMSQDFIIEADKKIEDVSKAYHKSMKKFPKEIHPTEILSDYEENTLEEDVDCLIRSHGFDSFPSLEGEYPESVYPEILAEYVVWFMNQGDPDLNAKVIFEKMPTFTVGQIGYGLFNT